MNIELLAKEIQKLGTDIEIITPKEDDEFVVKLLAELSPHTNTVAHDGAGMIDKYCKHDVQVLYNLDGQYFPCEHNKTMVILDTESEIQSNHLTSSDKWFWNEGKQQLLNRKNSDHYIDDMENKEGNSRGSWANILRTSFSALAPYEQTGQLVPVYAGPITEHAIDQITILDSVENVKQKIYNGATHIAFDDKDEALYWTRVYSCHSVIKRLKDIMPPGRFLFLTGALNGKEIYSQWCKDHGLEEELIMIPCARFEAVSKDMMWDGGLMHHHAEMDLPVYTGIRPKKYLCYNRMPRLHRLKIVTELHKAGIINQGLVSFYNEDNHLENPGWQEGHIEDQAWKETFEYFYENIFPELDYVLNKTEERWNPADLQRDDIDQLRFEHMLDSIRVQMIERELHLQIIPSFNLNINWTDLVPCHGSMTFSVGDAEFTDRDEMEKWYDQSIDTRANHMLQINHSVFADKLYRRFTKNESLNLETEFKIGFLRHTDKLTHPGLCDELIEMAKAPGNTIPK